MPDDPVQVLELYKLSVEMADRISARRGTANSFYVTLQTGLTSVAALLATNRSAIGQDRLAAMVISIVGITLSLSWWALLRSYRQLNGAKFDVILSIERDHLQVQPFAKEWETLKKDPIPGWRGRYAELGTVERVVPLTFAVVYLVLGLRTLLA